MANWQEIKGKLGKAAETAVKKTGELADSAAKHVKLKALDGKLSGKYEKLGRLTYKQLKSGESQAEDISKAVEEIDSLRAQRKALSDEIEADKKRRSEAKSDNCTGCETEDSCECAEGETAE